MVQALSDGMSAYKSLPPEITRKVNVNKAYKAAKRDLNGIQTLIGGYGFAGTVNLAQHKWVVAGLALLACGLSVLYLIMNPDSKNNRQTAETLHAAYDEIVARAKAIKKK